MASSKHVIVVGAGIIGASIAWHLTRGGARVTVIAEDLGGVATPNSFAWINASWGNPEFYFHFRRRAMAEWTRLANELPGLPLSWCSGLCWDMNRAELDAYAEQHGRWGYNIRPILREAIAAREPYLAALPDFALDAADEGAVEPVAAARLMLADAEARGTRYVTAVVRGLIRTGERLSGVVTSQGLIEADHVVLAAGAGIVPLAASAGISVPLEAPAGLLVHSRPFAKRLNGLVIAPELHMRQTADGRIVAGSDFGGSAPGLDRKATAAALFDKVRAMLRDSAALTMESVTVGYRPTPADGFPIIGGGGSEGLYLAVMHSGVTLAPLVGQLAASEILSGKDEESLAPFRLSRFGRATLQ